MNIKKAIVAIRNVLNVSQSDLAKMLDVSQITINRWESEFDEAEIKNIEKVYSFAFEHNIFINKIYEQILKDGETDVRKIIFHGARNYLEFPIDLKHSKTTNDFGVGFYLGENLNQAGTYVTTSSSPKVYSFELNVSNLKIKRFNVSEEWMLTIAYYRGWLEKYKDSMILKKIIAEVEQNDVIIAPIADNKMFNLISEFVRGEITDKQCEHALAATNLGMQYVLRTEKAIENLKLLDMLYISEPERKSFVIQRSELNLVSQSKVQVARIEFRGKGRYVEELLKWEN